MGDPLPERELTDEEEEAAEIRAKADAAKAAAVAKAKAIAAAKAAAEKAAADKAAAEKAAKDSTGTGSGVGSGDQAGTHGVVGSQGNGAGTIGGVAGGAEGGEQGRVVGGAGTNLGGDEATHQNGGGNDKEGDDPKAEPKPKKKPPQKKKNKHDDGAFDFFDAPGATTEGPVGSVGNPAAEKIECSKPAKLKEYAALASKAPSRDKRRLSAGDQIGIMNSVPGIQALQMCSVRGNYKHDANAAFLARLGVRIAHVYSEIGKAETVAQGAALGAKGDPDMKACLAENVTKVRREELTDAALDIQKMEKCMDITPEFRALEAAINHFNSATCTMNS